MQLQRKTCRCGALIDWGRTAKGAPIPLECSAVRVTPDKGGDVFGLNSEGHAVKGFATDKGGVLVRESHYARCPKAAEIKEAVRRKLEQRKLRAKEEARRLREAQGAHPNAPKPPQTCEDCGCPLVFIHVGGKLRGGPEEGRMVGGRVVAVERGEVRGVLAAPGSRPWEGMVVLMAEAHRQCENEPRVLMVELRGASEGEREVAGFVLHKCKGGM